MTMVALPGDAHGASAALVSEGEGAGCGVASPADTTRRQRQAPACHSATRSPSTCVPPPISRCPNDGRCLGRRRGRSVRATDAVPRSGWDRELGSMEVNLLQELVEIGDLVVE